MTDTSETPNRPRCELCGEPMPPGEEMFKYHGYSGACPEPTKVAKTTDTDLDELDRAAARAMGWRLRGGVWESPRNKELYLGLPSYTRDPRFIVEALEWLAGMGSINIDRRLPSEYPASDFCVGMRNIDDAISDYGPTLGIAAARLVVALRGEQG